MPELTPFERDIRQLEIDLRTLEAEYTMHFSGRKPRPPVELRNRVDAAVKRFDRSYIQSYADRFRFLTIQTRYAKLVELWDRSLRTREEGRFGPATRRAGAAPEAPAFAGPADAAPATEPPPPLADEAPGPPTRPAAAPPPGYSVTIADPTREVERLKELHAQLVSAGQSVGQATPSFTKFSQLVRVEMNKLQKTGKTEVTFQVGVKDGKVAFKAKPGKAPK